LVASLQRGLERLLRASKFGSIAEVVGSAAPVARN